jgi:hypothetical protein
MGKQRFVVDFFFLQIENDGFLSFHRHHFGDFLNQLQRLFGTILRFRSFERFADLTFDVPQELPGFGTGRSGLAVVHPIDIGHVFNSRVYACDQCVSINSR